MLESGAPRTVTGEEPPLLASSLKDMDAKEEEKDEAETSLSPRIEECSLEDEGPKDRSKPGGGATPLPCMPGGGGGRFEGASSPPGGRARALARPRPRLPSSLIISRCHFYHERL